MSILVSKAGLEAMKKELEELQAKLSELRHFKGAVAIHSGDAWHDNNDFEQCEIDERRMMYQIEQLQTQIGTAYVVGEEQMSKEVVDFGAKVTLLDITDPDDVEEQVVTFTDVIDITDLSCVSANSPLGKAIYKKAVGEKANYTVRDFSFTVEIKKIEY